MLAVYCSVVTNQHLVITVVTAVASLVVNCQWSIDLSMYFDDTRAHTTKTWFSMMVDVVGVLRDLFF